MKILTIGSSYYSRWMSDERRIMLEDLNSVKNADLIVFTGGSDVDPSVYGHTKHSTTYSDKDRDDNEIKFYNVALKFGIPMIGICRGAQFLTACQPGGMLVQNVRNHACMGMHDIEFSDGEVMPITSTHHQMMYPFEIKNFELIAWSSPSRSKQYDFGDKSINSLPDDKEPEIVFYPETKCLCVQGHPEMMSENSRLVKRLKVLIEKKLLK